jgi:hypothetical protein
MPNRLKPVSLKRLKGTFRPLRETERLALLQGREDLHPFVAAVVNFFMGEPIERDYEWITEALQEDWTGFARRLWGVHEGDIRDEYKRRYPKKPTPGFWKRYAKGQ